MKLMTCCSIIMTVKKSEKWKISLMLEISTVKININFNWFVQIQTKSGIMQQNFIND